MSLRDEIFAAGYDRLSARWEKRHGSELRRKVLEHTRGRVLEIGVGTGLSLPTPPGRRFSVLSREKACPFGGAQGLRVR